MTQDAYESAPDQLTIRELTVKGKVLTTTLLSAKTYPRIELAVLYKKRWHVEVDLRNIKTTLGMQTLSCKTPDMVEKEMWVYFLEIDRVESNQEPLNECRNYLHDSWNDVS